MSTRMLCCKLTAAAVVVMLSSGPALAGTADETLRTIKQSIMADPELQSVDLRLNVTGDTVTASGTTSSTEQKQRIERIIRQTPGVARIDNRITVDHRRGALAMSATRSDEELARDLKSALQREGIRLGNNVNVSIDDGVARFTGEQQSFEQIDKILSIALNVPGIRQVDSKLTVGERPYSALKFKHEDGSVTRATDSDQSGRR